MLIGSPCGAFAIAHRPWGGLSYVHKQHLDLLPNIAAGFAAQGWGKPGFWFVLISLFPYACLVVAAARLLKAVPLLLVLLLDKINDGARNWIWQLIIWFLLLFPIFNGLKMVRVVKHSLASDLACMHWPAFGVNQICPRGWQPVQGSFRLFQ